MASKSGNRSSIDEQHHPRETGYTVDTSDLLFTPERDYLVKNNGHKVRVDELEGKSIVLFIFPLWQGYPPTGEPLDMIQVYNELLPLGNVEFVFVSVHARCDVQFQYNLFKFQEDLFQYLFHIMPFPAIPLSDCEAWNGPLMKTFGLDGLVDDRSYMPYWVVIDPGHTVAFTRFQDPDLFKLFGGAELYPLSSERIRFLLQEHWSVSRQERINKWDQLLASPHRDYLISSEGKRVPVSSLRGKVVGLYFCDNVPYPPNVQLIKRVYEEAKLSGYGFEIVQINFPWHSFKQRYPSANSTLLQCPEGVSWFILPFKDPSCRKLQRIFPSEVFEDYYGTWGGDSLVIIDARQAADTDTNVPFEFSGVKILRRWGIQGYPFTRPSLFDIEYKIQKRDVTLQSLFPPEERLRLPSGELANASELLSGKKVLVLFSDHAEGNFTEGRFVSMLLLAYNAQKDVTEEDKFEVVYVSTHYTAGDIEEQDWRPSYRKFMKDMPWLAHPYPRGLHQMIKVFKACLSYPAAAVFDRQGKLIAKQSYLDEAWGGLNEFPFISRGLESYIEMEVNSYFERE